MKRQKKRKKPPLGRSAQKKRQLKTSQTPPVQETQRSTLPDTGGETTQESDNDKDPLIRFARHISQIYGRIP
jgi:hypothetical protein